MGRVGFGSEILLREGLYLKIEKLDGFGPLFSKRVQIRKFRKQFLKKNFVFLFSGGIARLLSPLCPPLPQGELGGKLPTRLKESTIFCKTVQEKKASANCLFAVKLLISTRKTSKLQTAF